jgi:hypothetical protein
MPPVGFEPAIPASKRTKAYALDPGTALILSFLNKFYAAALTGRFWSQKTKQGIEAFSFSS